MMQAREQRHRLFRVSRVQHISRTFGFLDRDLQSGIESSQVGFVSTFGGGYQRLEFTLARGVGYHQGRSFARNGILRASTVDLGDFDRKAIQQDLKNPTHDAQGVAAALMDIDTGVATFQARHLDPPGRSCACRMKPDFTLSSRLDATRTTDTERSLLFVV